MIYTATFIFIMVEICFRNIAAENKFWYFGLISSYTIHVHDLAMFGQSSIHFVVIIVHLSFSWSWSRSWEMFCTSSTSRSMLLVWNSWMKWRYKYKSQSWQTDFVHTLKLLRLHAYWRVTNHAVVYLKQTRKTIRTIFQCYLLQDNFMLDMYLAPHVNTLYSQIRNRALVQVSSIYVYIFRFHHHLVFELF